MVFAYLSIIQQVDRFHHDIIIVHDEIFLKLWVGFLSLTCFHTGASHYVFLLQGSYFRIC